MVGKSGVLFSAQLRALDLHEILVNFWPAKEILASQEGPCPVELVIIIIIIIIIMAVYY